MPRPDRNLHEQIRDTQCRKEFRAKVMRRQDTLFRTELVEALDYIDDLVDAIDGAALTTKGMRDDMDELERTLFNL